MNVNTPLIISNSNASTSNAVFEKRGLVISASQLTALKTIVKVNNQSQIPKTRPNKKTVIITTMLTGISHGLVQMCHENIEDFMIQTGDPNTRPKLQGCAKNQEHRSTVKIHKTGKGKLPWTSVLSDLMTKPMWMNLLGAERRARNLMIKA